MREWHVLVHVCREKNSTFPASGSAKCREYSQFSSGCEDFTGTNFHILFSKEVGLGEFTACIRSVDVTRVHIHVDLCLWPRSDSYIVCTNTHTKNIYAIDWPQREKRKLHTLCSISSAVPWRIYARFNTQKRQSLGTSPEYTKTSIRTLLFVFQ